jgi:hypothetical protein
MIVVSICDHGGCLITIDDVKLITHEVRGMAYVGSADDGWLWVASGSGISKQRGLHLYRLNGGSPATLQRTDPAATKDWHGLRRKGKSLYASNCTKIVELNPVTMCRREHGGIVPGSPQPAHLNDFAWHPEHCWVVSQFNRGISRYSNGQQLFPGSWTNPHSVTVDDDGLIWWCDSSNGALMCEAAIIHRREGRYCRGLDLLPDGRVLVGFSCHRGAGPGGCSVVELDRAGNVTNEWEFPYREIYQIMAIPERITT